MSGARINVIRKRGRPATGTDPMLAGRVPMTLIAAVEAWATRNGVTRSEAVRRLIQIGLEQEIEREIEK